MTVNSDGKIDLPTEVLEEAADWLMQLHEQPRDELLRQNFETWLASSSLNRVAWQRTQRAWQAFGSSEPVYREHWEDAPRFADNLPSSRPRLRRATWRIRGMLAVSTVTSLCLATFFAPTLVIAWRADYRTTTAESRSIRLEDGSTVQLAASSAIATNFSGKNRKVELLEGEAFFDVVRDEDRPFIVDASGVKVQVLGTAFNVDISDNLTSIALARGAVNASLEQDAKGPSETLAPGDLLVVDTSNGTMQKEHIVPEDIGGWRNGRLHVVNRTIGSVVEQIQRYHTAWLTVPDPVLARQTVTGFYDLQNPDQALEALVEPYGGKVRDVSKLARVISRF